MARMRLRDHNGWDLALTAVTLSATALAAGLEVGRRVAGRHRRTHGSGARPAAAGGGRAPGRARGR